MRILLGQAPGWLFFVLELSSILVAGYFYAKNKDNLKTVLSRLLWAVLSLKLLKSVFFTWSQWYVWHVSRPELLTLPLATDLKLLGWLKAFSFLKSVVGGYFIFYSFGHFWFGSLIALTLATLWWLVLKLLARRRPEALLPEELSLAWITAAIAGWPGIVLFVPMVLVFTVIGTLYFMARKIDSRLPVGWPMLAGALIVFFAGAYLVKFLSLEVLKI